MNPNHEWLLTTDDWPHQQYALTSLVNETCAGTPSLVLASPTGGGKSRIAAKYLEWCYANGLQAAFYTNRKLLTEQIIGTLQKHDIRFGVRAANFDEYLNLDAPIQICATQTDHGRTLRTQKWPLHRASVVLWDEAHMQTGGMVQALRDAYAFQGTRTEIGLTATPIGLGKFYGKLIVAGTNSELRECGALLPCHTYAGEEIDTSKLEAAGDDGEFSLTDIRKNAWSTTIFGYVVAHWQRLNPEQRPALLFAPGVEESRWFVDQFAAAGIRAAHIDGETCYCDGETTNSDRDRRDNILRQVKSGEIKVLCNRFVMREGVDLPHLYHVILATPIGSLQSYVQVVGRVLRAHPDLDHVIIQDHGGNYYRHGSPNADREWQDWFHLTPRIVSAMRAEQMREKKILEPSVCSKCGKVRAKGMECYSCGHIDTKKRRVVIQRNGTLRPMDGDIFKPRRVDMRSDTEKIWTQCYYRCKNSGKTFSQAEGLFFYENHYWPKRELAFMPKGELDWFQKIKDVPKEKLR